MNYIGIDVGGTNLKAGLVSESGELLATTKMKIASISNQEMLVRTMVDMTCKLAEKVGIPLSEIASVGVGVPGAVEIRSGMLLYTCNLPLRNVPLRRLFHKHLRMPLYIENDANCAALGEYYVGAGRDSKRFVMVTLGSQCIFFRDCCRNPPALHVLDRFGLRLRPRILPHVLELLTTAQICIYVPS